MRLSVASLIITASIASSAHAQPGMTPPGAPPGPPPPAQAGQPAPTVPPPYAYGTQPRRFVLSSDDADLLERGEVSDVAYVGGAAVAVFFGFGLGQAVQGRWGEEGWIFTLGETASIAALIVGVADAFSDCADNSSNSCSDRGTPYLIGGFIGLGVFRIWEVVDALVSPPAENRRLHELRLQLGIAPPAGAYGMRPFVAPARGSTGGGVAGVALSF